MDDEVKPLVGALSDIADDFDEGGHHWKANRVREAVERLSRPSNPDAVKLDKPQMRAQPGRPYYLDGSIYDGMEAAIWLGDRTVAHCWKFADAIELVNAANDGTARQLYPAPDVERVAQRFSERASDTLHGMFDWDGVSDAQWEELTIKLYDVAADELTALTGDGIQDKSDA